MDQRLVEAARDGDVITLQNLLKEDPQVLEKASLAICSDSVLHVAALSRRVDFVKKIVSLMPSLAMQTNQEGLIPLHMASAQQGNVETVRELLNSAKLDDEDEDDDKVMMMNQCLVKDDEGRTLLHYAAFRGRIRVIEELIKHCPECVEEVTAKGETVLHLAVKANQLKALEVMVDSTKRLPNFQALLLKAKDINGKTVYDLAAAKKQFLVRLEKGKEEEIREETGITVEVPVEDGSDRGDDEAPGNNNKEKKFQKTVLVVETLIITLSYQGLTNLPSTLMSQVGEGIYYINWTCLTPDIFSPKYLLYPNLRDRECPANLALLFLLYNSINLPSALEFKWFWCAPGDSAIACFINSHTITVSYSMLSTTMLHILLLQFPGFVLSTSFTFCTRNLGSKLSYGKSGGITAAGAVYTR